MEQKDTHRLLLMRHAKAASPEGVADHERPLAARGRRDAPRAGQWLAAQGLVPELVVCSDAVRTRQTTELLLSGLRPGGDVPVQPRRELYEASVHGMLDVVAGTAESIGTLLLVGHEPTTSAVVSALTGRQVSFPTAAVAVVELDGGWADVAAGAGRLVTVHTPRE